MKTLPGLRVRYANAFAHYLADSGISLSHALGKSRLDRHGLDSVENWMPLKQLEIFLEHAFKTESCFDLGLKASLKPRQGHSEFSSKVLFTNTLCQTLEGICKYASIEDTSAFFRLARGAEETWLDCGSVQGPAEFVRQVELYRFGGLLKLIRRSAGPNWLPTRLHLQCQDDGMLQDNPLLRRINIHFGQVGLAIPVANRLLACSPRLSDEYSESNGGRVVSSAADQYDANRNMYDYGNALREVIRNQLSNPSVNASTIARITGVSTRTLQRTLDEHGTTFSELLEQCRIELGRRLLDDQDLSVDSISRELGYRHCTNFSRAFRRTQGISPKQYRAMMAV